MNIKYNLDELTTDEVWKECAKKLIDTNYTLINQLISKEKHIKELEEQISVISLQNECKTKRLKNLEEIESALRKDIAFIVESAEKEGLKVEDGKIRLDESRFPNMIDSAVEDARIQGALAIVPFLKDIINEPAVQLFLSQLEHDLKERVWPGDGAE